MLSRDVGADTRCWGVVVVKLSCMIMLVLEVGCIALHLGSSPVHSNWFFVLPTPKKKKVVVYILVHIFVPCSKSQASFGVCMQVQTNILLI